MRLIPYPPKELIGRTERHTFATHAIHHRLCELQHDPKLAWRVATKLRKVKTKWNATKFYQMVDFYFMDLDYKITIDVGVHAHPNDRIAIWNAIHMFDPMVWMVL